MKTITVTILLLILFADCPAQDEVLLIDKFRIRLQSNTLLVSGSTSDAVVYRKIFNSPVSVAQDLDNDGVKELLITDCRKEGEACRYTVFIFNTVDSFYVVDSIYSGLKQPYTFASEEISEEVLVTGSPDFDSLYAPSLGSSFSPVICWQYNGSELQIINDKLYDIFISENEAMIEYIDVFLKENGRNCISFGILRQAIASVYANYITADEQTNAEYTLKRYYSCDDLDKFKALITSLL